MNRSLASSALIACALAVVGASQQPEQQQPVFRGARDAVRVFATVTDRDGRLVTTLEQENFEVRDEGTPQPIIQFDKTPQAIRLIVMLDVSGSMEGNAPLLRAAGAQLFARLLKDDVARVGSFGSEVTISPAFTSDRRELNAALPTTIVPGSPTPLWRAIEQAMGAFGEDDGRRKVILVLSDGKDSGPTSFRQRPSSQADVIDRARLEDVMIYAVGLRSRSNRPPPPEVWGQAGCRPCSSPTCPILVSRGSPRKPAAAISRSGSDRISAPRSRASPTSCTRSICSRSHRQSATAKSTTSASGSRQAA